MTADEVGRYEIGEAAGRVFMVDTATGATWVLVATTSASPRWKKIDTEKDKAKE